MQYLDNLLRNNPKLRATYVQFATKVVGTTLIPLNSLMRHVLVIQGIDPNSHPGDKLFRLANEAMDQIQDTEEYAEDYDFSWVERQWKKTAQKLNNINLTKERYRELTNLARLEQDEPHNVQVVSPSTSLFDDEGNLNSARLSEALKTITKYAEDLEDMEDLHDEKPVKRTRKTVSKPRQPVSVDKAKTTKKAAKTENKFKGVFKRIEK